MKTNFFEVTMSAEDAAQELRNAAKRMMQLYLYVAKCAGDAGEDVNLYCAVTPDDVLSSEFVLTMVADELAETTSHSKPE